jgi:hypothetical protein
MDINTQVLKEVAYQLQHGNPWWGMALCNEYMQQDSLFRKVLVHRFVSRIGETKATTPLARRLIAGGTSGKLSTAQQQELGARQVRAAAPIATPRLRSPNHQRLAVRTRLGASARFTSRELNRHTTTASSVVRQLKVVGA